MASRAIREAAEVAVRRYNAPKTSIDQLPLPPGHPPVGFCPGWISDHLPAAGNYPFHGPLQSSQFGAFLCSMRLACVNRTVCARQSSIDRTNGGGSPEPGDLGKVLRILHCFNL